MSCSPIELHGALVIELLAPHVGDLCSSTIDLQTTKRFNILDTLIYNEESLLIYAQTAMIPPTIYYSKVGLELSKLIVKGQQMSPP